MTLLALHNPVYLAHRLAMLDHMARGRFQWGIGGGAIPTDLALFGLDPRNPAAVRARSAEVLEVVLGLWAAEDRSAITGSSSTSTRRAFDPVKDRGLLHEALPAAPPAHRGGGQHARLQLHADGRGARLDPDVQLAAVAPVPARPLGAGRDRRRQAPGARPTGASGAIARDVLVGPTPAVARERARAVLGRNYVRHQLPNRVGTVQLASTKLDPAMPDEAVTADYLMDNVWLVGDPSESWSRSSSSTTRAAASAPC